MRMGRWSRGIVAIAVLLALATGPPAALASTMPASGAGTTGPDGNGRASGYQASSEARQPGKGSEDERALGKGLAAPPPDGNAGATGTSGFGGACFHPFTTTGPAGVTGTTGFTVCEAHPGRPVPGGGPGGGESGVLPFTGFGLLILAAVGAGLVASGLEARRQSN